MYLLNECEQLDTTVVICAALTDWAIGLQAASLTTAELTNPSDRKALIAAACTERTEGR